MYNRALLIGCVWFILLHPYGEALYCPGNFTPVESGNHCIVTFGLQGNITYNEALCRANNATLPSISNERNLEVVCSYAKAFFKKNGGFFFLGTKQDKTDPSIYRWNYNRKPLDFGRKHWLDEKPVEYLKCIELYVSGNFCRLNDIVCWKPSYAFCEFRGRDICLEDNGGCEQTCMARGYRTRTCKCLTGTKVNDTKCETIITTTSAPSSSSSSSLSIFKPKIPLTESIDGCRDMYSLVRHNNTFKECIRKYARHQKYTFQQFLDKCSNESLPLYLTHQTIDSICKHIRLTIESDVMIWVNINYFNDEPVWNLTGQNLFRSHVSLCTNNDSTTDSQIEQERYVLHVDKNDVCCLNPVTSNSCRQLVCQSNPCTHSNGGCSDHSHCFNKGPYDVTCSCDRGYKLISGSICEDIDECETDNGGCHQKCKNYGGGFRCECQLGFALNKTFKTECYRLDGCSDWNGDCQQQCVNLGDGQVSCECFENYTLSYDTFSCEGNERYFVSTIDGAKYNFVIVNNSSNDVNNGTEVCLVSTNNNSFWVLLLSIAGLIALMLLVCCLIFWGKCRRDRANKERPTRNVRNIKSRIGKELRRRVNSLRGVKILETDADTHKIDQQEIGGGSATVVGDPGVLSDGAVVEGGVVSDDDDVGQEIEIGEEVGADGNVKVQCELENKENYGRSKETLIT